MRVLRSSFIRCITHTTSRRSADFAFSVASEGTDLDPNVNIFVRRIAALRRYFYKDEGILKRCGTYTGIIRKKGTEGFTGVKNSYGN